MKKIDFHTHSYYSDGTSSPENLVSRAFEAGLELLILTDHDTVSGFPRLVKAAQEQKTPVSCGIEINTASAGVHMLGYGLAWDDPGLAETLAQFRQRRLKRVELMIEKLRGLGLPIGMEDVSGAARESLGRPHIADALMRKKIVQSRQEAFERFLSGGKPGYVESLGPSPQEAIALIRRHGGFPSLAHPQIVKETAKISEWVEMGLEGIERFYAGLSAGKSAAWGEFAKSRGLIETGGSDFHGPGSGRDKNFGMEIPDEAYQAFVERLSRCPHGIYRP